MLAQTQSKHLRAKSPAYTHLKGSHLRRTILCSTLHRYSDIFSPTNFIFLKSFLLFFCALKTYFQLAFMCTASKRVKSHFRSCYISTVINFISYDFERTWCPYDCLQVCVCSSVSYFMSDIKRFVQFHFSFSTDV